MRLGEARARRTVSTTDERRQSCCTAPLVSALLERCLTSVTNAMAHTADQLRDAPPETETESRRASLRFAVTVTGTRFTAHERTSFRDMLTDAGITHCRELVRGRTTHLVLNTGATAGRALLSDKLAKAVEWGIPVVRLQWLTDSVSRGEAQPVGPYLAIPPTAAAAPPPPPPPAEQAEQPRRGGKPRSSVSSNHVEAAAAAAACTPAAASSARSGRPARSPLANVTAELQQMSISPPARPQPEDEWAPSPAEAAARGPSQPSPSLRGCLAAFPQLSSGGGSDASMAAASPALCDDRGAGGGSGEPSAQPGRAAEIKACSEQLMRPAQQSYSPNWSEEEEEDDTCVGQGVGTAASPADAADDLPSGTAAATPRAPKTRHQPLFIAEEDSCEEIPSPCSPPQQRLRSNRRLPTGVTQLAGPLVGARARAPQPELPPGAADAGGAVPLRLLPRAPRGAEVKRRHGLVNLKAVAFAEQLHLPTLGLTLDVKDKKMALRFCGKASNHEDPLLGEALAFYQLSPEAPWMAEVLRLWTAPQAEAAAAAAGLPLALPRGFDRRCELLRSCLREAAEVVEVRGVEAVRQVVGRVGAATVAVRGSGAPAYFWRYAFDPDAMVVVVVE
jgi:hypothetical protein